MRLFKIILVFFAIYFIRRFLQLYRAMEKRGRDLYEEERKVKEAAEKEVKVSDGKTVEAEFKVIDR